MNMIQMTILAENEKKASREVRLTHDSNMTLMSSLLEKGLISGNFCGGRGECQRCRVQFLQAAPIPTNAERKAFTPEKLREGYRLACMARPKNNCVIRLDFIESGQIDVLTNRVDVSEKNDRESQQEQKEESYLIAVDLGTTTIAMQLMAVESGQVIDTYCAMNPQRTYGADVLSRIQAAGAGHAQALQRCVWETLAKGISQFCNTLRQETRHFQPKAAESGGQTDVEEAEPPRLSCMCIAGNTTMEHLLMGLPTESLGRSPFTPAEIGLQTGTLSDIIEKSAYDLDVFGITKNELLHSDTIEETEAVFHKKKSSISDFPHCRQLPVYIMPGISAFVGGDIVAGLYHCNLLNSLQPQTQRRMDGAILFLDLGTNGEMAITDGVRTIVTAAAAGPAFEGGVCAAVQGSDMIAIMASLRRQGIIDETGLLENDFFEKGVSVPFPSKTGNNPSTQNSRQVADGIIHLTQKDIRSLQMAKAAVRAGVEILCEKMGNPSIIKVYLAGGFGYYLDVDAAVSIGLLPDNLRECTQAAGNASLAGAFEIGRDLCTGKIREETLMKALQPIESVNLAKQEKFETLYLHHLNFPKW